MPGIAFSGIRTAGRSTFSWARKRIVLTSNGVLQALACQVIEQAKRAYERAGGKITRFHSTRYQAPPGGPF